MLIYYKNTTRSSILFLWSKPPVLYTYRTMTDSTEQNQNIFQEVSDLVEQVEQTWKQISSVRSSTKTFQKHLSKGYTIVLPKKTPVPKKKATPKKSGIICGDCSEDCGNHYKIGGVSGRYYCDGCWEYIEMKYCVHERYSHPACDVCVAYRRRNY